MVKQSLTVYHISRFVCKYEGNNIVPAASGTEYSEFITHFTGKMILMGGRRWKNFFFQHRVL